MDPVQLAADFRGLMKGAGAPIIAYELVSRNETINHARVLTSRAGLESLARINCSDIEKVRVDFHKMCVPEHYERAEREDVLTISMKSDAGYDFSAYAFED